MSASETSAQARREGPALARAPSTSIAPNPVLGNPFALHDHRDTAARAAVIERYREKYDDDLRNGGPMAEATEALAQRVRSGERLVLMCWCWPKPCHGRLIVAEINRRVGLACEGVSGANAPKGKSRST
jgi:hypothetical protein